MKPSQPMMSAAQAARALGKKTYEALVEVGDIRPAIDECGVARVPIEEVERCLSRRAVDETTGHRFAPIAIHSRAEFAEVKKGWPIGEATWRTVETDPRVDYLVLLFIPDNAGRVHLHPIVASRAGLRAAVLSACDAAEEKGLVPVLVLDPDGEEFAILNTPSLDTFKNQIKETRAARKPKEHGNG